MTLRYSKSQFTLLVPLSLLFLEVQITSHENQCASEVRCGCDDQQPEKTIGCDCDETCDVIW